MSVREGSLRGRPGRVPPQVMSRRPRALGPTRRCAMACADGFTLIELLVAMAIVAVIGVMALGGLSQVIKERDIAKARSERWREIQFAMRVIELDLSQIHPRPTRDDLGEATVPAVYADPNALYALEFSRGGWTNPAGFKRGTVLRVAYAWEDQKLVRLYWPVMDRTLSTPPVKADLLTGVQDFEIRFLDSTGQWQTQWPPIGAAGREALVSRPRAIEVTVDLKDFGTIRRIVETSSG